MIVTPFRALVAVVAGVLGLGLATPLAATAAPGDPPGVARVAAVYPLTVPEQRTALINSRSLAQYTSATGILTRELDAVFGAPVAVGIDPLVIASIRALGSEAPESATAWLDRLDALPNDTFSLTWADSDITLALQAGSGQVLAPTSLDFAIVASRFAAATTATPTPGSTPPGAGTAPPLPTTESLTDWDYTLPAVAWPVAGTVAGSDLTSIATSGYTTTILSSGNVDRSDPSLAKASVGTSSAVVTDDALSLLFAESIDSTSTETWEASTLQLQAAVTAAAAAGGAEGATILLAVDRDSLDAGSRLPDTLAALDALDVADEASLSTVLSAGDADAALVDSPQSAERVALAASLLAAEASDAAFSSVAENPVLITGDRRARLLATLSTAWNSYPGGWSAAADDYLEGSTDLHSSVQLVQSSDITLVADRASLPVTVSNALSQPVTVYVTIRALSPILAVEQTNVKVTIEPDSQKRAQIPVQSLSNGSAQISVSVVSATSFPVGTPTAVRINVYAGWETPTTIAIAILVFAVFAFGIARTILRRRRLRDAPEAVAPGAPAGEDSSPADVESPDPGPRP